jgi:hypothetical protein
MKTTVTERAALARAAGPQITQAELESLAYLNRQREIDMQIGAKTPEQRRETSAAAMRLIIRPEDKEAVRAAFWNAARTPARRVAVMAGGMPKEHANKPLSSFDAIQRSGINREIERLIEDLRIIQKCMNGGHVKSDAAVH